MKIKIGGKEFKLKPLMLNDWITIEDLGVDMVRLRKNDVKFSDLRILVYVAVKAVAKDDAEVTLEWVGENIDITDGVVNKIINFINPKVEPKPANS